MKVNPSIQGVFPGLPQACRCLRAGVLLVMASGWTGAALAENAPAENADEQAAGAPADSAGKLQEVVVSARRREELLENVPVSVSALSANDLVEQRVQSESDLQSATPGFLVQANTSSNQLSFSLRGQTQDINSGSTPAVPTYFNEFQSSGVTSTAFFDLQSVQVLKGPQGTLFGRNATGGAVLYEAVSPGSQLDGYLRLTGGNFADQEAEGAINLPFGGGDVAALRIAGQFQQREGFQHNLELGINPDSINDDNIRVSLRLTPLEQLENLTTLQYGKYGGYNAAERIANVYPIGATFKSPLCIEPGSPGVCHLNTTAASLYGPPGYLVNGQFPSPQYPGYSGIEDFVTKQGSQNFYDVTDDRTSSHDAHSRLAVNKTTYTFSPAAVLKNITGYNKVVTQDQTGDSGNPYEVLNIGLNGGPTGEGHEYESKQYSEELQLSGLVANDRLNYVVGGYYGRDFEESNIPFVVGADFVPIIGAPISGPDRSHFVIQDTSRAGYFQGSYELIPGMHATAGIRETWEDVAIVHLRNSIPIFDDVYGAAGVPNASQTVHKPSWTGGLDYQVTPQTLLYVAQRGSYRVGGFNGTSSVVNPANPSGPQLDNGFRPETTWDVEIGAKFAGALAGMPARLTLAVYDQTVKDVQRVAYFGITAETVNAPEARTTGVEFGGQLDLTRWLQVGVNYAYTDARYINGRAGADIAGVLQEVMLGPYGSTPKDSGSAYVRVVKALPDARGELVARGDVFAQSGFFYSDLAGSYTPGTYIGGYSLMNLRLEWNDIFGSKISVAAWGRNLTDKQYLSGGFPIGAAVGLNVTLPGDPRTFGGDVFMKF